MNHSCPAQAGTYAAAADDGEPDAAWIAVAAPNALRIEDIVQRIVDNRARFERRNAKREKKELDYVTKQKTYVREL